MEQNRDARKATALLVCGLALMVVGNMWPSIPYLAQHWTGNWNHFVRGCLMGIGIGLEISALLMRSRWERRCREAGANR